MKEFVTLTLGEEEWTFRALDIDQIELLEPQFALVDALAAGMSKQGAHAVAEIACESLKYKHPQVTVALCRKLITVGTLSGVIQAVSGVSGLDAPKGEEPARAM